MSSEWPLVPLEDLTDGTPITYGVVKPGEECLDGVRFVRGGDVVAGQVQISQLRTIAREVSKQYSRTLLRGGELLVSLVGNPGEVALAPKSLAGANIARQVGLVRLDSGKVYPNYVQFFLRSRVGRGLLLAHSKGSVQQVINLADLKSVRVPLPPLPQQAAVANFMQDIDDRITLLRETNATLEAIAQALFKSWFVDFDPVRAKRDGRAPEGMDEATAALFPDSFEDSELGEVPRGWRYSPLGASCSRVESGGTPKRSVPKYWAGDVPWLTSGEVRAPIVFDTKEKISELGVAGSSAKLWPAGTTVVAMYGATAGEVCLLANPSTANQACCGLLPRPGFRAFLFLGARREREALAAKSSGSAQQNLNKGLVEGHRLVHPSDSVAHAFEVDVGPMLDSWIANEQRVQTLAAIRDILLPRLISGQLRLPDAMAEEAV